MPNYDHVCTNQECNYEWEDSYSIKVDPPKNCPKCNQETAKRLISLNGKPVVELTGQELNEKLKADGKQLQRDAAKSTSIFANLIGENKYHQIQTQMDRRKRK